MIFQIVQVASFVGFVETPWKRVSAANAGVSCAGIETKGDRARA
jgi:hypothetical protein